MYRNQNGFTLLETIVVIVLIAISVTLVVVNLERDTDSVAELEARRFASLVEQARDESMLSGRPYAVEVDVKRRTYGFLQPEDGEWKQVHGDDVYRPRRIPEDLDVAFKVLDGPGSSGVLVIEGLGEITPFEMQIKGDEHIYTVGIDTNQQVNVIGETQ